jgi:pimeloyl-ACP methyl ester carboxylesterase
MIALVIVAALLVAGAGATVIGSRMIERRYPPRGRWIVAGGLRQHGVELGTTSAGKPPIVLLHGAGCNLEDLRALGERLAAAHRVILVDRPGQGWSEGAGRATRTPAGQAAILREVLDRLGIRRAILAGHSWGGTLAVAFALDHPDRTAGLVLLAPSTHPQLHRLIWLYGALSLPFAGWLFARTLALPLSAMALPAGVRGAFKPQSPPADYLTRSATWLLLRPHAFLANARDVAGLRKFLVAQVPRYGSLHVPAVVISGEQDPIVAPRLHAMPFTAALPDAKLVLLPGVGHMPHHAAPERIIGEIEELAATASSQ